MLDTTTEERRTLPAHHQGAVQCLALIDVLNHPSYHNGLQHHALVTGGGTDDNNIIISVLLDQFGTDHSRQSGAMQWSEIKSEIQMLLRQLSYIMATKHKYIKAQNAPQ